MTPIAEQFNTYLTQKKYAESILPNLCNIKRDLNEISEILFCCDTGALRLPYGTAKLNLNYVEHIDKLYNSCRGHKALVRDICDIVAEHSRLNNLAKNNPSLDDNIILLPPTGLESLATEALEVYARLGEFKLKLPVYIARFLSGAINNLSNEELNKLAMSQNLTDAMVKQIYYLGTTDKTKLETILGYHRLTLAEHIDINNGKPFTAVGVTYDNPDGSSRQDAIREAMQNNVQTLCIAPYVYQDKPAYALTNGDQILGIVPKEISAVLSGYNLEHTFCKVTSYYTKSDKYNFDVTISAFGRPISKPAAEKLIN